MGPLISKRLTPPKCLFDVVNTHVAHRTLRDYRLCGGVPYTGWRPSGIRENPFQTHSYPPPPQKRFEVASGASQDADS